MIQSVHTRIGFSKFSILYRNASLIAIPDILRSYTSNTQWNFASCSLQSVLNIPVWHTADNASRRLPQHTFRTHFSRSCDTPVSSHLLCHAYPRRYSCRLPQPLAVRHSLHSVSFVHYTESALPGTSRWEIEPAGPKCSKTNGAWISGASIQ